MAKLNLEMRLKVTGGLGTLEKSEQASEYKDKFIKAGTMFI
jgi:hypothetical protein